MKNFYEIILSKIKREKPSEEKELLKRVDNALLELNRAKNQFDNVVGLDNVELAILELNTAEKRYLNLIKEAKSKNIIAYDFKNKGVILSE